MTSQTPRSEIHYGKYVESETPITGVFSQNGLEYIHDDVDSGIDPDAESYRAESLRDFLSENPDSTEEDFDDSYIFDGYEQSCALIGFREVTHRSDRSDSDVHYEPDPDAEYSAIAGMGSFDAFNCVQVIASKWLIRAALCSPCFPGQADGDSPGSYLAFAIPPDVIGFDGEPEADALRARIFPADSAGTTEPAPTAPTAPTILFHTEVSAVDEHGLRSSGLYGIAVTKTADALEDSLRAKDLILERVRSDGFRLPRVQSLKRIEYPSDWKDGQTLCYHAFGIPWTR